MKLHIATILTLTVTSTMLSLPGELWAAARAAEKIQLHCPAPETLIKDAAGYFHGETRGNHPQFSVISLESYKPFPLVEEVTKIKSMSVFGEADDYVVRCHYKVDPEEYFFLLGHHEALNNCKSVNADGENFYECNPPSVKLSLKDLPSKAPQNVSEKEVTDFTKPAYYAPPHVPGWHPDILKNPDTYTPEASYEEDYPSFESKGHDSSIILKREPQD